MLDLFGESMPLPAKFFIAFAVVLALIGLTAWLVRRFGANRLGGANARGRQPRLAVIDAAPVDGRRRLVLIRRDNVEHLLMIGGPTDVVVEQNIVRAASSASAREPARGEPARAESTRSEPSLRAAPAAPEPHAWPLQPAGEPTPVAAPRPYRAAATEEPWLPPEPGARARPADSNSLAGLAAELSTKFNQPEVAPPVTVRSEPPAVRVNPPAPPVVVAEWAAPQQNDNNLAEMAQQLEAALRRTPEPRPPVTDPLALPPKAAEPAPRAPARDYKLRIDPKFETRPDAKFDARPEPKLDVRPEPKLDALDEPRAEPRVPEPRQPAAVAAPAGKNVFDNLEEEMASLLGRPPGKT
ncbi:MAG: flagellar biosynthetic protein FliO [Pseudolabrys sp.]|nr:flagellar biosynthetic protein FliO [Pseudolabrys sp.]